MRSHVRSAVLAAAVCDSAEGIGRIVCEALAAPSDALARVWLRAPDGSLQLVASAGHPTGGGSYHKTDGQFSRIAAGAGKIGLVAMTCEPLIVRALRGDEDWLANPAWIARQAVRGLAAFPLLARGQALGALALFSRATLTDETLDDLRFLADFVAVRLHAASQTRKPGYLTRTALRDLERRSIEAALAHTNGRVFGPAGAAALLDVKPTTLASRIKALRIDR